MMHILRGTGGEEASDVNFLKEGGFVDVIEEETLKECAWSRGGVDFVGLGSGWWCEGERRARGDGRACGDHIAIRR
jgi:hypothetical protein